MNVMPQITAPEELGLDPARLANIPNYFNSYIDRGKLAGVSTLVSRHGEIAHFETSGLRDKERGLPMEKDTIFRIYSMTKPITTLALMMLYEEGHFQLSHPVSRYIPAFGKLRVWAGGTAEKYETKPCEREMTIRDLLTHTSGLTYGFMYEHPVDALYRKTGIDSANTSALTLAETVEALTELPLLFSPGAHWNYSVSTDVCGHLVEILSGRPLDEFLASRIFAPLGMNDTGFFVPKDKLGCFATNYFKDPKTRKSGIMDVGDETSTYAQPPRFLSGGGGLTSTMIDYWRFCQMLLNGGMLDEIRICSPKTIEFMTVNHLPGGQTMKQMALSGFSELAAEGAGFGLGVQVVLDPAEVQAIGSPGNFSWGGAASTYFWIDPQEDLIGILMTQLYPSSTYPLRPQLQQLVYGALTD